MRINARLDSVQGEKLKYLQSLTHEKVTEIVRHSIDLNYLKISGERGISPQKLLKSRLIGCSSGDPSLSKNYKSLLSQTLSQKYGHR